MTHSLYTMSDTHDDLEAVARAVDYAQAQGKPNSRIIHAGDLILRPCTKKTLEDLFKTADTQGRVPPEAIETFMKEAQEFTEKTLNAYKKIFDTSKIPYTVIPGNYDPNLENIFKEQDLHNKSTNVGTLVITGYGGAGDRLQPAWIGPSYLEPLVQLGRIQLVDEEELEQLLRKEDPHLAVIHCPPYGMCDDMYNGEHEGTMTHAKHLLRNNNLRLILSGHIHEAGPNGNNPNGVYGVAAVKKDNGKTAYVINPGNLGRFEMMDPRTLEPQRQFPYGTFVRIDVDDDGTPLHLVQYSVAEEKRSVGVVKKIREIPLAA